MSDGHLDADPPTRDSARHSGNPPRLGMWAKVILAFLPLGGAAAGYGLGRGSSWGWNGFWCIVVGFELGTFTGLVVADGDERWSFIGALTGAGLMTTLWLWTDESVAAILADVCRAVFGAFLGVCLVVAVILEARKPAAKSAPTDRQPE